MTLELTGREHQVAELIGDGLPYKAIAAKLGCKSETVRSTTNRIASRLPNDGRPAYRRVMFWVLRQRAA